MGIEPMPSRTSTMCPTPGPPRPLTHTGAVLDGHSGKSHIHWMQIIYVDNSCFPCIEDNNRVCL